MLSWIDYERSTEDFLVIVNGIWIGESYIIFFDNFCYINFQNTIYHTLTVFQSFCTDTAQGVIILVEETTLNIGLHHTLKAEVTAGSGQFILWSYFPF